MTRAPEPGVTLTLPLERAADVIERLYPNGKLGGLMLDGAPPGPVGAKVRLTLRVKGPTPRNFTLHTQLAWARRKASVGLRECFGLDFLPEDEGARDRLVSFARGQVPEEAQRNEERLSVALPAALTFEGRERREELADLSVGGAFLRTQEPLPVGSEVVLSFRPPRALTKLRLRGRVTWRRVTGPVPGMGLRFEYETARQAARMAALMERLTQKPTSPARPAPPLR